MVNNKDVDVVRPCVGNGGDNMTNLTLESTTGSENE